jgi:hypothetical protein
LRYPPLSRSFSSGHRLLITPRSAKEEPETYSALAAGVVLDVVMSESVGATGVVVGVLSVVGALAGVVLDVVMSESVVATGVVVEVLSVVEALSVVVVGASAVADVSVVFVVAVVVSVVVALEAVAGDAGLYKIAWVRSASDFTGI